MAASYFEGFCFSLFVSVWVCAHEHRYRGAQVPDCMELLLQVVVSSPTKVQGTKLDSSTRAVCTLNLEQCLQTHPVAVLNRIVIYTEAPEH